MFSSAFKTRVVLEALKEQQTIEEIGNKHHIHPNQVSAWKREFLSNASAAFEKGKSSTINKSREADTEKLYSIIGQLKVENEWMKKKLN